uniref:HNH endonuclease n=1 Tax=Pithovirus LCPAC404 TaxID=2506597 RepID=A0A481ZBR8_9VIRU|nr:MAG: hypothetical protein LCPAC404_00580 [Pithovirus LCPAC404]
MNIKLCGSLETSTGNPCTRRVGKARLKRGEQLCSYHDKDAIEKKEKITENLCVSLNTSSGKLCQRRLTKARILRGEEHCARHDKDAIEKKEKMSEKLCGSLDTASGKPCQRHLTKARILRGEEHCARHDKDAIEKKEKMSEKLCGSLDTASGNPCRSRLTKARLDRDEQHCSRHDQNAIEKKEKEKKITKKICTNCDEKKLLKEFHKSKNGRHGVRCICKKCIISEKIDINYPRKETGTKQCIVCKEDKDVSFFHSDKNCRKDGLSAKCKDCRSSINKATNYPRKEEGTKKCFTCKETKDLSFFHSDKKRLCGLTGNCKDCIRKLCDKRLTDFETYMNDKFNQINCSHKGRNLEMTILKTEFFNLYDEQKGICPGTGFNLQCEPKHNTDGTLSDERYYNISPDRVDSDVGYINENVQISTYGYNIIKGSLKENFLFKICNDIDKNSKDISKLKRVKIDSEMKSFIKSKLESAKYRAKFCAKNIKFDLTPTQIFNMYEAQKGECNISGRKLTSNIKKLAVNTSRSVYREENYMNLSIDRIDSSGDYTIDNVQLVCSCINIMKKEMSQDIFMKFCKAIAKTHPCE